MGIDVLDFRGWGIGCLIFFAFLGILFASSPSRADWGTRMLAYKCNTVEKSFFLQPFIQWNDNYFYNGLKLDSPNKTRSQFVKDYFFISLKNTNADETHKIDCNLGERKILVFWDKNVITVVDTDKENSWVKAIDMTTDMRSAWDVYGPLYAIKTNQYGAWSQCFSEGDIAKKDIEYNCDSLRSGIK